MRRGAPCGWWLNVAGSAAAAARAPFVGRDREFRLIKERRLATGAEGAAGWFDRRQGGIGKSRLAWEFLKYIDGVTEICSGTRDAAQLRGGHQLLGAGRDGPHAGADHRGGGAERRRPPSWRRRSTNGSRGRTSAAGWSRGLRSCWASTRGGDEGDRGRSSRHGGCSSSGWPRAARWCWSSRTSNGRIGPARLHRLHDRVVARAPI